MPAATDIQAVTEKAILSQYAPTGVLIDDTYEILHFVGHTEKFLAPPTGKPSFNILKMVREDLKFKLTAALHKADREKKRTDRKGVRVNYNDTACKIDISISPVIDKGLPPGLFRSSSRKSRMVAWRMII